MLMVISSPLWSIAYLARVAILVIRDADKGGASTRVAYVRAKSEVYRAGYPSLQHCIFTSCFEMSAKIAVRVG
jgi:hypothetical protein